MAKNEKAQLRHAPGTAPGTLLERGVTPASVALCDFGPTGTPVWTEELAQADITRRDDEHIQWFNVIGLGDAETLRAFGEAFGIDNLVLEDIQNRGQRPKFETYDRISFAVIPMPDDEGALEQVSILWGEGFVITFNERVGDCFSEVRKRIDREDSLVRQGGADFLAYVLVDAIIDHYAPILSRLYDELDAIEEKILQRPSPDLLPTVLHLRRDVVRLRRVARPLTRVMLDLLRPGSHLMDETRRYVTDTADHAARNLDTIDAQHDLAAGLLDLYQGRLAHETNEVTRLLTVVATVFMPLGVIAGIYGMNFSTTSPLNMPELSWRFGYPFALGLMAASASGLLIWMYRRGVFGARRGR